MHNKYLLNNLFSLLVITIFISSCSSTTYIEKKKPKDEFDYKPYKNQNNISLYELNKSSNNIIKRFTNTVASNSKKKRFLYVLANYLKTPYEFGGESKSGMDCSGLTQTVYKQSLNVNLPRTAREQFKIGERIRSKVKLVFGDLVFFDTSNNYFPGHVGIFLENDLFAHVSSSRGMIISSLNNTYYASRYIGATRIKVKRKKTKIKR